MLDVIGLRKEFGGLPVLENLKQILEIGLVF